ncbi:MAG: ubiquitin carboxyl-hydrolase [Muribaculum sp.]|nr:ubiquitin carboxyl-hydrolase [Muribaculum sp.]
MTKKVITPVINVNCPNCGTSITIAEVSEPTNNTTINKAMKAEAKLEALRNAGVNVDNLFSMKSVNGQEIIARMESGNLTVVPDDDPIFAVIIEGGTVYNPKIARRWVTAQTFHMLTFDSRWRGEGFVAALRAKGYKYMWKMILREIHAQFKMSKKDPENFKARNRWFNASTVSDICYDYFSQLHYYVEELRVRHCKGVPYVKIKSTNVFVADLNSKVFRPLDALAKRVRRSASPSELFYNVRDFVEMAERWWMPYEAEMPQEFINAYKGVGAYYTMKNLILFHGATFKNGCVKLSQQKSLQLLEAKAAEYESEGWRLFGVMKKLINESGIDIKAKMAEWRK